MFLIKKNLYKMKKLNFFVIVNYDKKINRNKRSEIIKILNDLGFQNISFKIGKKLYHNENNRKKQAILQKLYKKIDRADLIIVILDNDSWKSSYVEDEIRYSLKKQKPILILSSRRCKRKKWSKQIELAYKRIVFLKYKNRNKTKLLLNRIELSKNKIHKPYKKGEYRKHRNNSI